VCFDRLPLIANLPPLVLDCSRLTLLDLGRRDFMYSTNLPPAAQARPQLLMQTPTLTHPCWTWAGAASCTPSTNLPPAAQARLPPRPPCPTPHHAPSVLLDWTAGAGAAQVKLQPAQPMPHCMRRDRKLADLVPVGHCQGPGMSRSFDRVQLTRGPRPHRWSLPRAGPVPAPVAAAHRPELGARRPRLQADRRDPAQPAHARRAAARAPAGAPTAGAGVGP